MVSCDFLQAVWPHSGHYRPTEENFRDFVSFLEENKLDLTDVKVCRKIELIFFCDDLIYFKRK